MLPGFQTLRINISQSKAVQSALLFKIIRPTGRTEIIEEKNYDIKIQCKASIYGCGGCGAGADPWDRVIYQHEDGSAAGHDAALCTCNDYLPGRQPGRGGDSSHQACGAGDGYDQQY